MDYPERVAPPAIQDTKHVQMSAQPVLTALVEKVNSPTEVENLLQRFAQQAYDRYGAAVCQHAAVRDLLTDGMLASIDPSRLVRLPSEEGELAESTTGDIIVKAEPSNGDHVQVPAAHSGDEAEQGLHHDRQLTHPASEPSNLFQFDPQSPPGANPHFPSDHAGPIYVNHGLPAVHDETRRGETLQAGHVSRLTSKHFATPGDDLSDQRDWSCFHSNASLHASTIGPTLKHIPVFMDLPSGGQEVSLFGHERTEHAVRVDAIQTSTQPAHAVPAAQSSVMDTSPAIAQINPARASLMQSQSTEEFVPWFREEEQQRFQPTGANVMPLSSTLGLQQMDYRPGTAKNGHPTNKRSGPGSVDQSEIATGTKSKQPSLRGRKRKRAESRDHTPDDANHEPGDNKTVVLNLLDPGAPYEQPAHQKRIVDGLAANLAGRVDSYLVLGAVPGLTLPRLVLQGRMPDGARIDFDCRATTENANDVRGFLRSILLRPGASKQKRVECDKILRHVARWNPALFPELSSTLSTRRVCLQAASPNTYKSFLDILAAAEHLRITRPLRAIDGYSIASRIFDAARYHVRRHAPDSILLQDPDARTLFSGAGYNPAALHATSGRSTRPAPAKFSLVRGGIGTPRRSFLDTLESAFMIQATKSEDFEAELERLLFCLAEQDKMAWPEVFA